MCLLVHACRPLGASVPPHVFLCVAPLWATLGFLMAWGLRSTGDHSKDPEPGPEREEEEKKREGRDRIISSDLARIPTALLLTYSVSESGSKDSLSLKTENPDSTSHQ